MKYREFKRKIEKMGYEVQENGTIIAFKTPYKIDFSENSYVKVLNPVWDISEKQWKYKHTLGRLYLTGSEFVEMVPNMKKKVKGGIENEFRNS